jgi:hypothetical protein
MTMRLCGQEKGVGEANCGRRERDRVRETMFLGNFLICIALAVFFNFPEKNYTAPG